MVAPASHTRADPAGGNGEGVTAWTLQQLKEEYSRLIYASAKTANSYNRIMFLFASESFNQMLRRLIQLARSGAEV